MINTCAAIRAMKRGLLAVFLVFTASSASQAGPIGVPIEPFPVIFASFINSLYIASTGAFTAQGSALYLDRGPDFGPKQVFTSTTFRLVATIESSTGKALSGTITIGAPTAPLLISNTLVGFAYVPVSGGALEFLFGSGAVDSVAGSLVASGVYSNTEPLDVMITSVGFPGHLLNPFGANWSSGSNTALVREDPVGVPEPSTLLLMLAGAGAGAGGLFRRRKEARL